ncbi:cytochrome c peroxidase [Mucilaginibacter myungsuensis]|uniref:Cytochrome-c peroxidase n=1 Tax=Mucilaginibacter myungsuensis TaxID=649104 RepID=A0A929L7A2_9SPHI|nr:cytochrome c peroxidase [Mucilaginibacter myungsuensis]MBE9664486.1 cytochrome-c peroxidase [Mucilaginibacter myungsuensis]MDN3601369.1 cytochrome c peroxidase [Mucilaginibacter myungsuensis]
MLAKNRLFAIITAFVLITFCFYCKNDKTDASVNIKKNFDQELIRLQSIVDQKLFTAVQKGDQGQIKSAFLDARRQYKTIEYYIEYYFPSTAVMLNGAPVDEIELGENLVENPTGFQVMEAIIYGDELAAQKDDLLNEVKKMQLNLKRVARFNEQYQITDAQLFDAIRLEMFRITGLGITGFDTPDALQSLPEAASALEGIGYVLSNYGDMEQDKEVKAAITYLNEHLNYDKFDRLTFITEYLDPLSKRIAEVRNKLKIPATASGSALHDDAVTLFQPNAFNPDRFVGNATEFISDDKIALGKTLFSDAILSNNGDRSCMTCHNPVLAFTDGLTKGAAIGKNKTLLRNTPTLTYAGLQRAFFYDLKAGSLEDQALDVVHHRDEMNGSLELASKRINTDKRYRSLFKKAYKDSIGKADAWKIQHALAAYIRSLTLFNSRLDQYMRGDRGKLNNEEKLGFNLFMGKAKCGACHFAPVFNGTAPALFNKSEAEVLGVPATSDTLNATLDADLGRYALSPYPQYKHAFKIPTLRNISKTAPYMHNGVFRTLEEVVEFYNRGGGIGLGIDVANQTLSPDPLKLTKAEMKAIVAFLKTLDDQ